MKGHIIRGRVDGTWYLRVELDRAPSGSRRQRRETIRGTKADAQRRLRDMLRDAENGGFDATRMTVKELLVGVVDPQHECSDKCNPSDERHGRTGGWLESVEQRVGTRTFGSYKGYVRNHILPALGSIRIAALRTSHIEAARAKWIKETRIKRIISAERALSMRTVKHIADTLKSACLWAIQMQLLTRNPCASLSKIKVVTKEMCTVGADGVRALLSAATGTELQLPIAVLVGTGLRRGELMGLRWSDIDLQGAKLTVRRSVEMVDGQRREKSPKTARSARTISLASFVVDALRRQRFEQNERRALLGLGKDGNAYVFDRKDGTLWNPDSLSWSFAQFIRLSKLPKIRLHDLRHSFATIALQAGVDLKTISASLGHSAIGVTANTYLHAVESLQKSAADRIEDVLGEAVGFGLATAPDAKNRCSVPQRCHKAAATTKKARGYRLSLVAPTGFEPVLPP